MSKHDVVMEALAQAYHRRIEQLSAEERYAVPTALLLIGAQRKLYLFRRSNDLEPLWAKIRENDSVCHFLTHLAEDFYFRLETSEVTTVEVIRNLAVATSCLKGSKAEQSVLDDDIYERLPSYEEASLLYGSNPWLVTLKLLLTLPASQLQVPAQEPPRHVGG